MSFETLFGPLGLTILVLALGTFAIRVTGVIVGQSLPTTGAWARALEALPGCLIISLVASAIVSGGPNEWIAAATSALTAIATRNLIATMAVGIGTVWALRTFGGL